MFALWGSGNYSATRDSNGDVLAMEQGEHVRSASMVALEELHDLVSSGRVERVGVDPPRGGDRDADLLEVRSAIGTVAEVALEPAPLAPREGSVEVGGHEFDGLLTHEVLPQ
jgi:hypothetical protein